MNSILLAFTTLFFTSCSMPNIEYDDKNRLEIVMDTKTIVESSGKVVYEHRVNLSNINIYQKVFVLDSGTVLTYEDLRIGTGYQFSYGTNRVIGIAFPNFSYDLIKTIGNIQFYKLANKKESIYMIVQNMNKKGLQIIYGINEQTFNTINEALANSTPVTTHISVKKPILISNVSTYIKSDWNEKNIILDNLITKVGGSHAFK